MKPVEITPAAYSFPQRLLRVKFIGFIQKLLTLLALLVSRSFDWHATSLTERGDRKMKRNVIRFSLLLILLAAVPQMSSAATFVGAGQNTNSSTTMERQPKPDRCKWRCRNRYKMCLHSAGADPAKRKACAVRYRYCLRHCVGR